MSPHRIGPSVARQALVLLVVLGAGARAVHAQCELPELGKLVAHDGTQGDEFGFAVGVSGTSAVVGAPSDDSVAPNAGGAYFFERVGDAWIQLSKVAPYDGDRDDSFGRALDLEGSRAAVGASRRAGRPTSSASTTRASPASRRGSAATRRAPRSSTFRPLRTPPT